MPNEQEFLYQSIDPHDFRVGHRYCPAPGEEHDYTVCRVSLNGDKIQVETFNGRHMTFPAQGPAFVTCDVPGS